MISSVGVIALSTIAAQNPGSGNEWRFNSTFGYCIAQQLSGRDAGVRIVMTPASQDVQIVVFDEIPWGDRPSANFENASVNVGPTTTYFSAAHAGPGRSEATRFVSVLVIDPAFIQKLMAASTVSVSHPKLGEVAATYRSPASAAEMLRKCEDGKMANWGIDPVAWHSLRMPPRPVSDFRSWIRPEAHRLWNLRNPNGQAVVKFTVETDGTIKECHGIDPGVASELSQAACAGLNKRARFIPAEDVQGNAVAAPYVIVAEFSGV